MLSRLIAGVLLAVSWFGPACFGQAKQEFEVASIKVSPPPEPGRFFFGPRGGPGTSDPTRYTCNNCTLAILLNTAYDLKNYQLKAPADINANRFDIAARVPEGTTKEQFRVMLQNLLADRFKMVVHRETKEMPVYELVLGKGAPKMKESADQSDTPPDQGPPPPPPGPFKIGSDGMPDFPPGRTIMMMMPGRAKLQAFRETMTTLVGRLAQSMNKPVTDATGLTKKYDFTLIFAPDTSAFGGGPGGPIVAFRGPGPVPDGGAGAGAGGDRPPLDDGPLFPLLPAAVQEQLGLKLESKKGNVDIVVVDKFEKTPTEN